jgi:hypothetical protein
VALAESAQAVREKLSEEPTVLKRGAKRCSRAQSAAGGVVAFQPRGWRKTMIREFRIETCSQATRPPPVWTLFTARLIRQIDFDADCLSGLLSVTL